MIDLYYFSGTGNSLYVAKEIKQRLPMVTLRPIVSSLDNNQFDTEAEIVGFVMPCYLTTIPAPVRKFIKQLNLTSATYIFSVITLGGTFCVANTNIQRLLKRKGKTLNAQFEVIMPYNTPTGIKPGKGSEKWVQQFNESKMATLDKGVQSQLEIIQHVIGKQENYPSKPGFHPFKSLFERLIYQMTHNTKTHIKFYADDTCTGCGICEQACLSHKIKMNDKNPEWQREVQCYFCYACFNVCPHQSILVKDKYTRKDGRYVHPKVTTKEIIAQK